MDNPLVDFHAHQQHEDDQHLDPALQQSNEINAAQNGYNPYLPNFARTDVPEDIKESSFKESSPPLLDPNGGNLATHHGMPQRGGGRTSVMLDNDGKPIPEEHKPPVGTEAYAMMRKVNHKEVERKRRKQINNGLDDLAKLIASPHSQPEKNKGAVLQKAVNYIIELKRNEGANIEKYTMDKIMCDQEINALKTQYEQVYQQYQVANERAELWKQAANGDESARARAAALDP